MSDRIISKLQLKPWKRPVVLSLGTQSKQCCKTCSPTVMQSRAAALRTTYAREAKYIYSSPRERFGRIAVPIYSQDHMQLPPVPPSSSMLAPLEGTSDEHKVGAKIFRNVELVFEFQTAMRFTDETLIEILQVMRKPGGKKLTDHQWQALLRTERSPQRPVVITGWYPVC